MDNPRIESCQGRSPISNVYPLQGPCGNAGSQNHKRRSSLGTYLGLPFYNELKLSLFRTVFRILAKAEAVPIRIGDIF
jgi:hypothetical protein